VADDRDAERNLLDDAGPGPTPTRNGADAPPVVQPAKRRKSGGGGAAVIALPVAFMLLRGM
jgi:hypothetical protein